MHRTLSRRKRAYRRLLLALAAAAVGANALAYLHARALTRFVAAGERTPPPEQLNVAGKLKVLLLGTRIPRPVDPCTPAALGLPFETRTLPGDAGSLEAWIIPHTAPRGLVILFHGYAASKAQVLTVAARLHALGWSAVLVDFRGSGGSQGERTSIGYHEARDVAAAVHWAKQELGSGTPVLYGFSMGAAAVLRAVAVENVPARAIVVEAAFDRMRTTIHHRFEIMNVPSFPLADMLVFWGASRTDSTALLTTLSIMRPPYIVRRWFYTARRIGA
jgi:uncharacterized protein